MNTDRDRYNPQPPAVWKVLRRMRQRYRRLGLRRPAPDCVFCDPSVVTEEDEKVLREAGLQVLPGWALAWITRPPDPGLGWMRRRHIERVVRRLLARELPEVIDALVGEALARRERRRWPR
jgi:hypothetical protein